MPVRVSIIITCYNAEHWIRETIQSALAQTYPHLEIIVIDDGSTDDSFSVVQSFGHNIRYQTQPNQGANVARNQGFQQSQGDYVLFLDGDDWLDRETIQHMVDATAQYPNAIIAGEWRYADQGNIYPTDSPAHQHDPIADELSARYTPIHALLFPREAVLAVDGWDETLRASQDVDLKLRCLVAGYRLTHIPHGMSYYRLHDRPSISKSIGEPAVRSRLQVLLKAERLFIEHDLLDRYRPELAKALHRLAATIILDHPQIGADSLAHAQRLYGDQSIDGTLSHRILCRTIGLRRKQQLSNWIRTYRTGKPS